MSEQPMSKPGRKGVARIWHASIYSWNGLKACWKHEAAFRQELLLCVVLLPFSFVITDDLAESALLIATLGVVLLMELVNSALEAVVDRIGPELHPLSGQAKDIGSAVVMVAIGLACVVWGLVAVKNLSF